MEGSGLTRRGNSPSTAIGGRGSITAKGLLLDCRASLSLGASPAYSGRQERH